MKTMCRIVSVPYNSIIFPEVWVPPCGMRLCSPPRPSGCQYITGLLLHCATKWDHSCGMRGFGHYHNKTAGETELCNMNCNQSTCGLEQGSVLELPEHNGRVNVFKWFDFKAVGRKGLFYFNNKQDVELLRLQPQALVLDKNCSSNSHDD